MKIVSLPTPLRTRFLENQASDVDMLKNSKLPVHHVQLAERLKAERRAERYGQVEFASEIGINRSSLANYEYGLAKVPFAVGLSVCERLDLNPRWLATGKNPKRPYVSPQELGVDPKHLTAGSRQRVDFISGYAALLEEPLERWLKANPAEVLARRQVSPHPLDLARTSSFDQLEETLAEFVGSLKVAPTKPEKRRFLPLIEAFVAELSARLRSEEPIAAGTELTGRRVA